MVRFNVHHTLYSLLTEQLCTQLKMPMQKSRNAPSDMIVANCTEHTIRDNNHQGYQQLMVHLWEKEPSLSCLSWEAWLFIYERPFREKYAMGWVIYITERHFCLHSWSFLAVIWFFRSDMMIVFQIKQKRFKKIDCIWSHHLHLQWKFKLLVG